LIMAKHHSDRFATMVDDAKTRIKELSPDEVKEKLDEEERVVVLDVRKQDEWESAHIAGAKHLARAVLERNIETEYANIDTELILYSGSGSVSALAADSLQKMGYNNIKSLAGGFQSWLEAGYPIERNDGD